MRTVWAVLRWLALLVTGAALAFDAFVLAVGVPKTSGMGGFRAAVFFLVIGAALAFILRRIWRWQPSRG